jgi:protein-tyrosine phosphatase
VDEVREIVCICFGNICRSPMMQALLQRGLDDRFGPGRFLVTGAGIGADDGRPPSQGTVRAMSRRGIDVRTHRSRALTPVIARNAWRVFAAETYQVEHALRHVAAGEHDKVRLFVEEVPDPYGSTDEAYEAVAVQIERLLPDVLDAIAGELGDGFAEAP